MAYEGMGDHQKAVASWERAAPATPVRRRRASGDDLARKRAAYLGKGRAEGGGKLAAEAHAAGPAGEE